MDRPRTPPQARSARRRGAGFSLVELMVSVVIGLLALLFATRLIVNGELNKSSALGGSDAMQNGMLALFSISNDAAQAGWGLNDTLAAGCDTIVADTAGFTLLGAQRGGLNITPLAAAVIQSNGVNPDQIALYGGSSAAGVGAVKLGANYAGGTVITTDTPAPYGFLDQHVLLVAPEPVGGPCTLVQYSGAPAGQPSQIAIAPGANYRFNTAGGMATAYGANAARIFNLGLPGKLAFHRWSLQNGILLLQATDLAGASAQPVSVIDNIVSLKAQYGFDTRVIANYNPDPAVNGMQIGQWSGPMIDADNDGVVGGAGDYQRIAALRIAVVARSKTAEKPGGNGQCATTIAQPVVFAGAAPAAVAAVPVALNVAVAGDTVDWKCYRYRVFETIVPVRNSQWRP